MARVLPDDEIAGLLDEKKLLPRNWATRLAPKKMAGQAHLRRKVDVKGDGGNDFNIDVRLNSLDQLDFSIILSFIDNDGQRYIIRRYNGKHLSSHTNQWEKRHGRPKASFGPSFHIHTGTERYQIEGLKIDGYAEVTNEYASFDSALRLFVNCNGFSVEGEDFPLLDQTEQDKPE